ncbi:unnamed protein product, partial [Mesorhabditis spiculigera]
MGQFLLGIKNKPESIADDDLLTLINVICVHSHEEEPPLSRKVALIWMQEIAKLYNTKLLPQLAVCLVAILPALAEDALNAKIVNTTLLGIIEPDVDMNMEDLVQLFSHMELIFPQLLNSLSDTSDEVLLLDLHLISDLCAHKQDSATELGSLDPKTKEQLANHSSLLVKFAISLIAMFRADRQLLSDRGVLIIRQLCLLIEPTHIYRCLCVLLMAESGVAFVQSVVSVLHSVLMTSTELFLMRDQLRKMPDEYTHAAELVHYLSEVDITVDILMEVDKLVNLIESPILAFVRMDLLRACHREPLCDVLTALLMLLPQTEAFNTLHKRIQAIPSFSTFKKDAPPADKFNLDLSALKNLYIDSLQKQQKEVRERHRSLLIRSALGEKVQL